MFTRTAKIVEFLSQCRVYPEAPRLVERIETHISWVFLTDSFAYKLKKAVKFDFLDFSTPELRRVACEEELRLNRRLAERVYLAVLPITESDAGEISLDGSGDAVDYVVKMVRLPAERALDRLMCTGRASRADMDKLADRLADFYRGLSPSPVSPAAYRCQIEAHVRSNRRELLALAGESWEPHIKRLHGTQLQLLRLSPELFDARVRAGRIVEGHGDLRPEHVYFLPEPVVLDCIEFNAEYRRIDVLDELGFLAMECDRLGCAELGTAALRRCAESLHDDAPAGLLAFYKSYRACVRAKVAALRGSQHSGTVLEKALAECHAYLDLAAREASSLLRPVVILVRGLSGTGKSTIATALAESLGAEWLSTDAVRQEMFVTNFAEKYAVERRAAVYDELLLRADAKLRDGRSVVLDGTFLQAEQCRRVTSLALNHDAAFLVVDCYCPDDVARSRVEQRLKTGNSPSEAFPELITDQKQEWEEVPSDLPRFIADSTKSGDTLAVQVESCLATRYQG